MPDKFYDVPSNAYLFVNVNDNEGGKPEEKVRQWALFELMRSYGMRINDLSIEQPVKAGTTKIFADIVVRRNHKPFIVIECKRREDKKLDKAMAQAVSYASSDILKAEYAVSTNGNEWLVKRYVGRHWVKVVDIPRMIGDGSTSSVDFILNAFEDIGPFLHKLGEPVGANEAQAYFCALQQFFSGHSPVLEGISGALKSGADNLFRILSTGSISDHYGLSKMRHVYRCVVAYANQIDKEDEVGEDLYLFEYAGMTEAVLEKFIGRLHGKEDYLLRLLLASFRYLLEYRHENENLNHDQYKSIPDGIKKNTESLIDIGLKELGFDLPDEGLSDNYYELKIHTASAWDSAKEAAKHYG